MQYNILIVDDEADIRNLVKGILEDEGYHICVAKNSDEAYQTLQDQSIHLIILDIWLQGSKHDGLEILDQVTQQHSHIPVIMISGHGTIETAVAAIKQGAYDFIEKPFKSDRLLLMVRRGLEAAALKRENRALKKQAEKPVELVGDSAFIKNLKDVLKRVSATNSRVLLSGEAGTGKGTIGRYIHQHSERAEHPFLILNCSTVGAARIDAELFGEGDTPGALEAADKGTLMLDEFSEIPLEAQGKLLRVLQDGKFKRIDGNSDIDVDVRIFASSNKDLQKCVEEGGLREDLYYRLNVVPIEVAPLRARAVDVKAFVVHFLEAMCAEAGLPQKHFSDEALRILSQHKWPGNIRQLKNVLEWVMIFHGGSEVTSFEVKHLPPEFGGEDLGGNLHSIAPLVQSVSSDMMELSLREAREAFERAYLFSQVDRFDGNISKTAQFIGMERSALHRKLKSLQVSEDEGEYELKEKRA